MLVAGGILYLRRREPERERRFPTPLVPLVPLLAIILSIGLMASLDGATWVRFGAWMVLGLVVYFAYSRSRSVVVPGRERRDGVSRGEAISVIVRRGGARRALAP